MKSGIYCYENKIDEKKYVGQSQYLESRMFQEHKGSNYLLDAIKVYGIQNFKIYILEECSIKDLDEREIFWIKNLSSHVSQNGYNISWGGSAPMRGRTHSEEAKNKIKNTVIKLKLKPPSWEGKFHKESSKEKVRLSKLGIPRSEDLKVKVSATKIKQGNKNKNSTSIYHNVKYVKRGNSIRWRSSVKIFNKGEFNIGSFKTELDAAIAYDKFIINNKLNNILNFHKIIHLLDFYFLFKICDIIKRKF